MAEIRVALQKLNTKSVPGPNGITNRALRNLDDQPIDNITLYINDYWAEGAIPKQWKEAKVILIPKPGRPSIYRTYAPFRSRPALES